MVVKLTEKELKIIAMRYKGLKSRQIAKALKVSEPDVSQTLSRIVGKIESVQDTLDLLCDIGIIKHDSEIELTESGQALLARMDKAAKSLHRIPEPESSLPSSTSQIVETRDEDRASDYGITKRLNEKNVSKSLKEAASLLTMLSDQVEDNPHTTGLTERKEIARLGKETLLEYVR